MRIKISYIIFVVLLIIATVYFFSNHKGTLNKRNSSFAIDKLDEITQIQILDDTTKLILTKQNNNWKVNQKYLVKEWNIQNFLTAINRLQVLSPVSNLAKQQVCMILKKEGIKVEILKNNRVIRKYYVSKPSMNKSKTYMLMNKSKTPFVVRIPSFKGLVANLYVADENFWRNKIIFKYKPQDINSIQIQYPANSHKSFQIKNHNDGYFSMFDFEENVLSDFDVKKVARFFTYFQKITFDDIVTLDQNQKDSIIKSQAFATITVKDFSKNQNQLKIYRKPAEQEFDEYGKKALFDYNKAFAVFNNSNELILIHYYNIDPLLKEIDYFR